MSSLDFNQQENTGISALPVAKITSPGEESGYQNQDEQQENYRNKKGQSVENEEKEDFDQSAPLDQSEPLFNSMNSSIQKDDPRKVENELGNFHENYENVKNRERDDRSEKNIQENLLPPSIHALQFKKSERSDTSHNSNPNHTLSHSQENTKSETFGHSFTSPPKNSKNPKRQDLRKQILNDTMKDKEAILTNPRLQTEFSSPEKKG